MVGFFIVIHALNCMLLSVLILMQSGRGGGLTETFSSAESMFGAKTNEFMVKATTATASVFLITSLSLAYFSAKKDRSLIPDEVVAEESAVPLSASKNETASADVSELESAPGNVSETKESPVVHDIKE